MHFKSLTAGLLLALSPSLLFAADSPNKDGYTGTLSSLDGGLEGTVTVIDTNTLEVMDFTIEDASAPALYWWGSETEALSEGFRISNARVTDAVMGVDLMVSLDAGKTTADFTVVGLWCERFDLNFGQTTLKAAGAEASASSSGDATATSSSAAMSSATSDSGSAPMQAFVSSRGIIASLAVVVAGSFLMG
jgi:Electron transfer DM13